jgi:fluoride exporter
VNLFLIAIGGAFGSMARYLLSSTIARVLPAAFPFGTLMVNVLGCMLFGLIVGSTRVAWLTTPEARSLLLVGVLGGFTTFSTFAYDSVLLLRSGHTVPAMLNVAGQIAIGMAALWGGYVLAITVR